MSEAATAAPLASLGSGGGMTFTLDDILGRLQNVNQEGKGWIACCPAHDDSRPSLRIDVGDRGKVLLICRSGGCSYESILRALGLWSDRRSRPQPAAKKGPPPPSEKMPHSGPCATSEPGEYIYADESGKPLFRVKRTASKQFIQSRWDGEKWVCGKGCMEGVRRVLYNLPALVNATKDATVFVVEGEKDVDRLTSGGLLATTSSQGAGKWSRLSDFKALYGHPVVVLPDNDDRGSKHAQDVVAALLDKSESVRVVDLPELPDKGDVSDWLDAGHTVEELQSIVRVSSREFVPHLESVNLSDVAPEEIRWLWQNRIPRGKLTVIAGVPGIGKSFATLDIASRVSSGTPWPDRRNEINLPGNVVILSAEDDPADTIRPRVDAAGGDPSRFTIIKGVQAEEDEQSRMFKLDRDLQLLEQHIRCAKARLAIIDPISAYLGKTDSHKDAEIRGVLLPLSEIAAGNMCAMVVVVHLNKRSGATAIDRVQGSIGLVGAARMAWLIGKDLANPGRRIMAPIKSNITANAHGIAFEIIDGAVAWASGDCDQTADDLLADFTKKDSEVDAASAWLMDRLKDGPVDSKELREEVDGAGEYTWATMRRAQKRIGVKPKKVGFDGGSRWVCAMPVAEDAQPEACAKTCAPSSNTTNLRDSEEKVSTFEDAAQKSEGAEDAQECATSDSCAPSGLEMFER